MRGLVQKLVWTCPHCRKEIDVNKQKPKTTRKRVSIEDKTKIVDLYNGGSTIGEIAKKMKMCYGTVRHTVQKGI